MLENRLKFNDDKTEVLLCGPSSLEKAAQIEHVMEQDKFQSAYRAGFSTETALLRVMNDLLCSINGFRQAHVQLVVHLQGS